MKSGCLCCVSRALILQEGKIALQICCFFYDVDFKMHNKTAGTLKVEVIV